MPEPTTASTRRPVPTNSASALRADAEAGLECALDEDRDEVTDPRVVPLSKALLDLVLESQRRHLGDRCEPPHDGVDLFLLVAIGHEVAL